ETFNCGRKAGTYDGIEDGPSLAVCSDLGIAAIKMPNIPANRDHRPLNRQFERRGCERDVVWDECAGEAEGKEDIQAVENAGLEEADGTGEETRAMRKRKLDMTMRKTDKAGRMKVKKKRKRGKRRGEIVRRGLRGGSRIRDPLVREEKA